LPRRRRTFCNRPCLKIQENNSILHSIRLGRWPERPEEVSYYVTAARDILLGIYKGNWQKLGDWGFTLTKAPKAAVPNLRRSPENDSKQNLCLDTTCFKRAIVLSHRRKFS
jgi:hypothetical protein